MGKFLSIDKKGKKTYENFLYFLYSYLENMINSSKSISITNKYNRIKKDVLEYVIVNKKLITSELEKKSSK